MKRYTNTPGSGSTFNPEDSYFSKKRVQQKAPGVYRVTGVPANEAAAFNAPVSRPAQRVVRQAPFIPPRRTTTANNPIVERLLKELSKTPTFTAPGFKGDAAKARIHTQQSRWRREKINALLGLAQGEQQNTGRLAQTRMTTQAGMQQQALRGKQARALEMLRGQQAMQERELQGKQAKDLELIRSGSEMDLAKQRYKNAYDLERMKARAGRQEQLLSMAGELLKAGAQGNLSQLANTSPEGNVDLSGITIPEKTAPYKRKAVYVRPQFDNKGRMLPGTGIWTMEPVGGGQVGGGSMLDTELEPDVEKELRDLYNSGDIETLYNRIAEIVGQ